MFPASSRLLSENFTVGPVVSHHNDHQYRERRKTAVVTCLIKNTIAENLGDLPAVGFFYTRILCPRAISSNRVIKRLFIKRISDVARYVLRVGRAASF